SARQEPMRMQPKDDTEAFPEFGGIPAASQGEVSAVVAEAPGRYRFGGVELGRGAMGAVRVAMDEQLGREVAIKELVLPPAVSETTRRSLERRFLREARITARLDHPNVVPVHEIGRRLDGTLYYVMKRVRGRTLRKAMEEATDLAGRVRLLPSFLGL